MPDLREEPGKIKYFDAAQHKPAAARRPGLRFTSGAVLRAATIALCLLALMALAPNSGGAARPEADGRKTLSPDPMAGAPCADAMLEDTEQRIETERARYGLSDTSSAGVAAHNVAAFDELVTAADALLALRHQRDTLMAELDGVGAGAAARSFDAIAAEIAQLDAEYQRQSVTASIRYPALGAVLHEAGPEAQDPRLVAVTGGPLNSAVDLRQLRPRGQQVGAGAVAQALEAHRRVVQQARDAAGADPGNRAALESLCTFTALARTSLAAARLTVADSAINSR
jgi:hypothetical protein